MFLVVFFFFSLSDSDRIGISIRRSLVRHATSVFKKESITKESMPHAKARSQTLGSRRLESRSASGTVSTVTNLNRAARGTRSRRYSKRSGSYLTSFSPTRSSDKVSSMQFCRVASKSSGSGSVSGSGSGATGSGSLLL